MPVKSKRIIRPRSHRTPLKESKFIEALRESASVTKACEMVAIGRRTAYDWRLADPVFAQKWDETLADAVEDLEAEARRRAIVGIEKGVWHQGKLVGTELQYSDTMLIFLLKAAKPDRYRDRTSVEHTGKDGGPIQVENPTEQALTRYRKILQQDGVDWPGDEQALLELATVMPELSSEAVN